MMTKMEVMMIMTKMIAVNNENHKHDDERWKNALDT